MSDWKYVTDEEFDTEPYDNLVATAQEFNAGSTTALGFNDKDEIVGVGAIAFVEDLVVAVDVRWIKEGVKSRVELAFAYKQVGRKCSECGAVRPREPHLDWCTVEEEP